MCAVCALVFGHVVDGYLVHLLSALASLGTVDNDLLLLLSLWKRNDVNWENG